MYIYNMEMGEFYCLEFFLLLVYWFLIFNLPLYYFIQCATE